MTDRELLERAAKAAGLPWDQWVIEGDDSWNPLTDDGDALRLAVKLRMCVANEGSEAVAIAFTGLTERETIGADADPYSALRRAIVRAAAAIGGHPA